VRHQLLRKGRKVRSWFYTAVLLIDMDNEGKKKQLLLRISDTLWKDLAAWAEDDFRSVNSQIEYLLSECVKKHKKTVKPPRKL
jgi:hypothetical protein